MSKIGTLVIFILLSISCYSNNTELTSNDIIKFWQENGVDVSEKVIQNLDRLCNDSKLSNMGVFDLFDNYMDFNQLNNDLKPDENGVYPDYKAVILGFTTKKVSNLSFFSSASLAVSKVWDIAALKILFDIVATNDQKFVNNQIEFYKIYISLGMKDPYLESEILDGYLLPPTGYLKTFGSIVLTDSDLTPEKVKEIVVNSYQTIYGNKIDFDNSKQKLASESYKQFEKNAESIEDYINGFYTDVVVNNVAGYNKGLTFYNTGVDTLSNLKLIKNIPFSPDKIISFGTINPKAARIITSSEIQEIDASTFDKIQFDLFGFTITLEFQKEIKPFVSTVTFKTDITDSHPGIAPEQINFQVFINTDNINDEPFEITIDYDDKNLETIQTSTHGGLQNISIPHTYKQKGIFFPKITVRNMNIANITSVSYDYLTVESPIKIKYPLTSTLNYYAGTNTVWTSESVMSVEPNFNSHWDFEYDNTTFIEDNSNNSSSWTFLPAANKFMNDKVVESTIALVASVNIDNTFYSDTLLQTVKIFNPVIPKFKLTPSTKNVALDISSFPYQVCLDASSSISALGKPLSYKWLINQEEIGSIEKINYNISKVGNQIIKLHVSDGTYSSEISDSISLDYNVSYNSNLSISQVEYFFDVDPGVGRGSSIPISFQNSVILAKSNISCSNLSTGLHRIYFRIKDSAGNWSTIYSKPVLITNESTNASITEVEYFLDEKPENSIGTLINFTASKDVFVSKNLSLANIAPGMHRIYFRAKDNTGRWSTIHSKPLLINNEKSLAPIKKIEYFFDEPTANVSASTLSFTPSTNVTVTQSINTSNVATGLHRLYFRAQDETGRWSVLHSKPILINNSSNFLPNISRLEYFIDSDPGLNSGITLPFDSSPDITVNSNIPLDTISIGSHNIYFRAKDSNGIWSFPQSSAFTIENSTQDIALTTGWNIISANVVPASLDLKIIFQPLIDFGTLKKVMDETGKTIEYFGLLNSWKNSIGNLNPAKGYKVKVTAPCTLSLEGVPVQLPMDINLSAGWNIISWPSTVQVDAKAVVQSLIDQGKLKKVMDETGKTIEYFGLLGVWKNSIGNFVPGKGYKVNVKENCTLAIPASGFKSAVIADEVLASEHFSPVFEGNGTDHMSIHLVDLQASGLQAGDQVGVFDGENCVGSATIALAQLTHGSISIAASADDHLSKSVNGFTKGHLIELQLYRDEKTYSLKVDKVAGTDSFEKNGSLFAQVKTHDLTALAITKEAPQFTCYPNPFTREITIEVKNLEQADITVEIYNITGQLIKSLFKGTNKNHMVLRWNGTNDSGKGVTPGIYLCKVNGRSSQIILERE